MTTTTTTLRTLAVAAAATLALAACGSGTSSGSATAAAGATRAAGGNGGFGGGGGGAPGASGLIADIQGSTLQVQSSTDQTAVVYTSSTKITTQVTTTATTVKVGDCVSARAATTPGAGSTGSSTGAPTQPSEIAATTVSILSTGGNGCTSVTNGFGGGFGGGSGGGGTRPSGFPSGRPSNAPGNGAGRAGGFGFAAIGAVTAVANGQFTVASTVRDFGSTSASPAASPSTRPVTVTWTAATTFETTQATTAKAIKVGECARAIGKTDDTGTVTATSLALSPAVNGQCTSAVLGG